MVQAEQQADSSIAAPQDAASASAQQAENTGAAPYTLKFSNHLGDIRMQKKWPSIEDESVLYFTAQWEQDGGGVYDVSKLTHPEVHTHLFITIGHYCHNWHKCSALLAGRNFFFLFYLHLHLA